MSSKRPTTLSLKTQLILDEYVDSATVHGTRDIFNQSKPLLVRLIWALILCCCFGGCTYEMYHVYKDFNSNPTVIQIFPFKPSRYPYPLVRYCPKSWIDMSKVRDFQIGDHLLIYILSHLHHLVIPQHRIRQFPNISVSELERQVQDLLKRESWTDMFDLYLAIAKDSDDSVQCSQCKNELVRPVPTAIGVCYDLEFVDYPWDTRYYADLACVGFTTFSDASETDYLDYYDTIFATDVVYMGEHPLDFFGWDPLFLNSGQPHSIQLKPIHKIRVPGGNQSICIMDPPASYSDKMCGSECAELILGPKCWQCVHLGHLDPRLKPAHLPWCSSLTIGQTPEMKKCEIQTLPAVRSCASKKCPSPCEIWEFDRALQLEPYCRINDSNINVSLQLGGHRVEFIYLGAKGTLVEELAIVDANIFISNMGCQIGLWFGGSAVSLWQMLLLAMKMIDHVTNREMIE